MSTARDSILSAVRSGLRGSAPVALPPVLATPNVPAAELVARFTAALTRVGGHCAVVRDRSAAAKRCAQLLEAAGAESLLLSDAPEVAAISALLPASLRRLSAGAARSELLAGDAGLTGAQWGIAETGTLVLVGSAERHRLASLLPPLHIVVLPVTRLLGSLGQAFARLDDGKPTPAHTITFITGPSRTADIELELVVGVHGPRSLHVLLLESAA